MINDLMEREEKYRTLTQNLNVGVYRCTSGKNGKFIEVNPAFLNIFGFSGKRDIEDWKIINLFQNPIIFNNFERKLQTKAFLVNEKIQLKKKDGTPFIASITSTVAKNAIDNIDHYDGIIEDITDEKKIRENVLKYQSDLKSLTNELIVAEERAKRRLAVTLHDKLGQYLALANFKTSELKKITTNSKSKKIIGEITAFIDDAIKESRDITYELSPPVLYEMGLVSAISWKLDEIEKNNKIKVSLINRSQSHELEEKIQIILYRTISELIQNIIKHSEAENLNVSFRLLKNVYRITISDNGIGFDLAAMKDKAISEKKFGIFSIIERIKYIGGDLNINSVPKKGTKVVIDIPIKNN